VRGSGVSTAKAVTATKAELRREIKELRFIGSQMANCMFNLSQNVSETDLGKLVSGHDLCVMKDVGRKWDAIKRAEATQ
jgi:hypothetical protein